MSRSARLLLLPLLAVAGSAAAQTPGVPVMAGALVRGVSMAAMAGFGVSGSDGTGIGLSGTLGLRRVAITGLVSRVSGSGTPDPYYGAGGAFTVKVAGGPLVPLAINLQAGAAYSNLGYGDAVGSWHIPVGLGISWLIPQPVVALKPWLAPRVDMTRVTGLDPLFDPVGGAPGAARTDTNFGLSGGLTFGFLNGMAVDLAFDRVFVGGDGGQPTTLGVGLSWNFR